MKRTLAALACTLACVAAPAAVLGLATPVNIAAVGDSVVVDIVGSAFGTATVGGGFSLTYNASVLSLALIDVKLTTPPWDPGFPRTETLTPGSLQNFSFNQLSGVSGSFSVASLTFRAVASGVSGVSLAPSALFPFSDNLGNPLAVGYGSGSVTVSAVPEPATFATLTFGLAGLWLGRMRRRSAAE